MRDMPLMLAIDLGSSQLKLLVMDENARVRAVVTEGYPTLMPGPCLLYTSGAGAGGFASGRPGEE